MKQFLKEQIVLISVDKFNFKDWPNRLLHKEKCSKFAMINKLCGRPTILHLLVCMFYSLWCLTISLTDLKSI